jgi:hypothetical protein
MWPKWSEEFSFLTGPRDKKHQQLLMATLLEIVVQVTVLDQLSHHHRPQLISTSRWRFPRKASCSVELAEGNALLCSTNWPAPTH